MKREMPQETKCEMQNSEVRPKELLRALRELGAAIEDLDCKPNYGGCCIIAAIVCKELERLGVPCEVATAEDAPGYRYVNTAKNARDNGLPVYEWDDEICREHLVVRFKAGVYYTWDTAGLRRDRIMPATPWLRTHPFGEGMSAAEAEELYSVCRWNRTFKVSRIPTIRKLARQYLRH